MMGLSFAPLGDDPTRQNAGQQGGPQASPVQEAIKVLSLKFPRIAQGAPAPLSLLNGLGGAGMNPIEQVLMQMFGGGQSAPTPDFDYASGRLPNGLDVSEPEPAPAPPAPPPTTPQMPGRLPRRGGDQRFPAGSRFPTV